MTADYEAAGLATISVATMLLVGSALREQVRIFFAESSSGIKSVQIVSTGMAVLTGGLTSR